jgi:hypothetical protein
MVLGVSAVALSAISLDPKLVAGVFLGAAIGWLNLLAVRALYERVAWGSAQPAAIRAAFLVKMVILLTVITVVMLVVRVNGVGFLVGFSTSVAAIMVVPLLSAVLKPGEAGAAPGAQSEGGVEISAGHPDSSAAPPRGSGDAGEG